MAKEKQKYILMIFIILAILLISFIGLVTWQVPYVVKESYTEKEPYEVQEPYQVQETYIDYEHLRYRVLERSYRDYFWTSGCDVGLPYKIQIMSGDILM